MTANNPREWVIWVFNKRSKGASPEHSLGVYHIPNLIWIGQILIHAHTSLPSFSITWSTSGNLAGL
jgi:hypothetical protein